MRSRGEGVGVEEGRRRRREKGRGRGRREKGRKINTHIHRTRTLYTLSTNYMYNRVHKYSDSPVETKYPNRTDELIGGAYSRWDFCSY